MPQEGYMDPIQFNSVSNRCKEHYKDLLDKNTTPMMKILEQLPHQPIVESMGEPPSLSEVQDAIGKMRNNKVAGPDCITEESWTRSS